MWCGVANCPVCACQEQSLLQPPTLQLLNGMGPLGRRASDGGANIQLHAQQLLKRPRGPSPLVTMTPVSSNRKAEKRWRAYKYLLPQAEVTALQVTADSVALWKRCRECACLLPKVHPPAERQSALSPCGRAAVLSCSWQLRWYSSWELAKHT